MTKTFSEESDDEQDNLLKDGQEFHSAKPKINTILLYQSFPHKYC